MTTEAPAPTPDPALAPEATPPATPPAPTPPAPTADATPPPDGDINALPDWARKQIGDLRKEAADRRTKANEAESTKAALLKAIGGALGLDTGEAPDPAALTDQLNATQAEARQAKVEVAALRAAAKLGADADALLDSRAFITKVAGLDPAADDFATALEAAVTEAIAANPKLKAGQAPAKGGADFAGGTGGQHIYTRDEIAALAKDPGEYAKHRDEIQRQVAAGLIA